jgi:NSS family neurotransmitter:Na+ symporter
MGQLFYSMSIAMGIMITYGSYMKKDVDMEKSISQIELFDTGIAFLAGMMVVPTVYAFSGSADGINAGPGLMFQTLPYLFAQMPMGNIVGTLFFILVLFAAITSSISIMETIVSIISDKFNTKRITATVIITVFSIIVALPSTLGFGIWSHIKPLNMSFLEFFDFLANSVLMPIVALSTCLFVAYVLTPQPIIEEIKQSSPFKREKLFIIMVKYLAPICVLLILITSILSVFGIMSI